VALGWTASALADDSIAIGSGSLSNAASGVCIGQLAKLAGVQNVVIGYNAGNSANTATGSVIIGQNAGTATNAASNTIIGSSASVSASRTNNVVIGANASASQSSICVLGANASSTGTNSNAIGFDVDNTTANTTLIGSNKSSNHIVDSEGYYRSVRQVSCVASAAAQVIGAGPTVAQLTTEEASFPASLLDNANDWIFLSDPGTEAAGRTYQLSATIKATAGATNNRWLVTIFLVEPGVGTREVAWCQLCASIATACGGTAGAVIRVNPAITTRPYFYASLTRLTGAANVTLDATRLSFARIN
jgi:hypothetical protein